MLANRALMLGMLGMALCACSDNHKSLVHQGLVYCAEGNPETFNPQLVTSGTTADATANQLYDKLIDIDAQTGEVLPRLAKAWHMSPDGLRYTFELRQGVHFHHTAYFSPSRDFDADDVIFSFRRQWDKDHPYHQVSGGEYPFFDAVALGGLLHAIERDNDHQVTFVLNRPDASFLSNLATDYAIILSAEYGQALMEQGVPERIDTQPVGTGPFVFDSYRKDSFIRYKANPDYWDGQVAVNPLIFDITKKSSRRLAKLVTGECDVTGLPLASEIGEIQKHDNLRLQSQPGLNVGFWAFNTERPPLNNPDVRRALAMAIEHDTIMQAVFYGTGSPANSLLPANSWAYDKDLPPLKRDLEQARSLLKKAGLENGFSLDIWAMPVSRSYNPNARKMAELIQSDLAAVNVRVRIVTYDWASFRRRLARGEHDSVLIGWSADNTDPDNFFTPTLSCSAMASGNNRANWCDPAFDTLLAKALLTPDREGRKAYYQQAQAYLDQAMPVVPLAHGLRFLASQNDIEGVQLHAFGAINFAKARRLN
ncbi:ABC transporter substrate-binding protein [Gallaecimonas xiamenensis]|uniref:Extracellular solute-binding protein n=1 Tax=Gallaecimonas xiamenensis 3-C-1 TaxID=745411 RepID=K2J081_9GAMM|nr:ABC transporter substrate-binding protein [Gallaecimonas xiamenensis]EKE76276.1 extracellular solute-binding protein [Gallaecimonas xiamenensis 3-C-1]